MYRALITYKQPLIIPLNILLVGRDEMFRFGLRLYIASIYSFVELSLGGFSIMEDTLDISNIYAYLARYQTVSTFSPFFLVKNKIVWYGLKPLTFSPPCIAFALYFFLTHLFKCQLNICRCSGRTVMKSFCSCISRAKVYSIKN